MSLAWICRCGIAMTDRIKLAKAMKLEIHSRGGDTYPLRKLHNNLMQPFDPYTDANDDCAVLEWMRNDYRWQKFKSALVNMRKIKAKWHGSQYTWNYKTGDYARAALKALE